jgi:hypothetical protein
LISTVRASLAPVPVSGLADQTMLPDVAEPLAELVGEPTAVLELVAVLDVPSAPVELLLPPLEPQAASASTPVAASATPTPPRRMNALPSRLRDILPPGIPPCLRAGNCVRFSVDDLFVQWKFCVVTG